MQDGKQQDHNEVQMCQKHSQFERVNPYVQNCIIWEKNVFMFLNLQNTVYYMLTGYFATAGWKDYLDALDYL